MITAARTRRRGILTGNLQKQEIGNSGMCNRKILLAPE
jgi:hypothetical protein